MWSGVLWRLYGLVRPDLGEMSFRYGRDSVRGREGSGGREGGGVIGVTGWSGNGTGVGEGSRWGAPLRGARGEATPGRRPGCEGSNL